MPAEPVPPHDADAFEAAETELRERLLDAQFDLAASRSRTLLILLNGPDGAGKGEVLNRLAGWLDPRALTTMAYDPNDPEEARGPAGWRWWRDLPAHGGVGVVLGAWYHAPLLGRVRRDLKPAEFRAALERINRHEAMLEREGVRLLKLWLHLGVARAAASYAAKRAGPGGLRQPLVDEWREIDSRRERRRLEAAAREMMATTTAPAAAWHIVPADDGEARDLAVGRLVLAALRAAHAAGGGAPAPAQVPVLPARPAERRAALAALDLTRSLDAETYRTRLARGQERLFELTRHPAFGERALVCAFEGTDAAGKGGAIKRLRGGLDPRRYRVHPIAAPSDEERARPYLWRFWRRLPGRGHVAIFDRSWYGRVLVERVEGLAAAADWARAYDEINAFEAQLTRSGYIVQKFWLAIDRDEQLRRFESRAETPHKRFKITEEDWRNRSRWPLYVEAVEDMVALTSTGRAPWTLVAANDKRFARVQVIETLVARLEAEL